MVTLVPATFAHFIKIKILKLSIRIIRPFQMAYRTIEIIFSDSQPTLTAQIHILGKYLKATASLFFKSQINLAYRPVQSFDELDQTPENISIILVTSPEQVQELQNSSAILESNLYYYGMVLEPHQSKQRLDSQILQWTRTSYCFSAIRNFSLEEQTFISGTEESKKILQDFWLNIKAIACDMLKTIKEGEPLQVAINENSKTIYVAPVSQDITYAQTEIIRELKSHGHIIITSEYYNIKSYQELQEEAENSLDKSDIVIHLMGKTYDTDPDLGMPLSHAVYQISSDYIQKTDLEKDRNRIFSRIVWIKKQDYESDEKQQLFVQAIQDKNSISKNTEILKISVEDLKTFLISYISDLEATEKKNNFEYESKKYRVYLLADKADLNIGRKMQAWLNERKFKTFLSDFSYVNSQISIRAQHRHFLGFCNGIIILFDEASDKWLNAMIKELIKLYTLNSKGIIQVRGLFTQHKRGIEIIQDMQENTNYLENLDVIYSQQEFNSSEYYEFLKKINPNLSEI